MKVIWINSHCTMYDLPLACPKKKMHWKISLAGFFNRPRDGVNCANMRETTETCYRLNAIRIDSEFRKTDFCLWSSLWPFVSNKSHSNVNINVEMSNGAKVAQLSQAKSYNGIYIYIYIYILLPSFLTFPLSYLLILLKSSTDYINHVLWWAIFLPNSVTVCPRSTILLLQV